MSIRRFTVLLSAALLVTAPGCGGEKTGDAEKKPAAAKPEVEGEPETKPEAEPATPPKQQEKLSAAHVLVMHKDSDRVPEDITRTKEEALARAKEALTKIQGGADFAEVAKEFSDCPSKNRGGDLGTFPPQAMAPAFTAGVKGLKPGEVTAEPVETKFGYHVIKRQEVVEPVDLAASLIVVMHKDSKPNPANATRTKEEALARAKEALTKIQGGADFAEVAEELSDHPNKTQGGKMGNFPSDRIPPAMSKALTALKIGEHSTEPLELPLGYHIFLRTKPVEPTPMSAAMIVVTHKDSQPNPIGATRTKEEALARVKEALAKIQGGADFAEVAKEFSDHPNKARGGDMGTMPASILPPDLLGALNSLKIGEMTKEPLDLSIGYHLLERKEPGEMGQPRPGGAPPMPRPTPPGKPTPPPAPAPAGQ